MISSEVAYENLILFGAPNASPETVTIYFSSSNNKLKSDEDCISLFLYVLPIIPLIFGNT